MIIDCVSDLHGAFPTLEGGDLLIVAGDLTASDKAHQLLEFGDWLHSQDYKKKVVIGGNHDKLVSAGRWKMCTPAEYGWDFTYLEDSGTEFEGLKIWGSPWTAWFEGINPHCAAWTIKGDDELAKKWEKIPPDTDILVTHTPPLGILDQCMGIGRLIRVGSKSLAKRVHEIKPRLHVFGHIHDGHGIMENLDTTFINAAIMDSNYRPVNKPTRIEL